MRFLETNTLFYSSDLLRNGSMDAAAVAPRFVGKVAKSKKSKKRKRRQGINASTKSTQQNLAAHDPVADALLEQWRHNCRDWLARIYAYAVPNKAALESLASVGPIVEIGAGTGYWAALLIAKGVDIVAFDAIPPHASGRGFRKTGKKRGKSLRNEYHGDSPLFSEVLHGDATALVKYQRRTLFLCYPPPGDSMALQCLQSYTGAKIAYVGEWDGLTADIDFQTALLKEFELEKLVSLPNFANQAAQLMIWKRRVTPLPQSLAAATPLAGSTVLRCAGCGRTAADAAMIQRPLKQCIFSREIHYCSNKCFMSHRSHHTSILALRHVFFRYHDVSWPRDFR